MGRGFLGRPQGHLDGTHVECLRQTAFELVVLYSEGAADRLGPCGHERQRQITQDAARAATCSCVLAAIDAG